MGVLKGWEAGEIGVHYATTLNIAPSKKAPKWGRNRKCRDIRTITMTTSIAMITLTITITI